MARYTSVNYTPAFPYADTAPDPFKKEDVQQLAVAVEDHNHAPQYGRPIDHADIVGSDVGDPHPQYLTEAEADALFLTPAEGDALFLTQAEGDALYMSQAETDLLYYPLIGTTTLATALTGPIGFQPDNSHDIGLDPAGGIGGRPRDISVGRNLTVTSATVSGTLAMTGAAAPGGTPAFVLGVAAQGNVFDYYDYATVFPPPAQLWEVVGAELVPTGGENVAGPNFRSVANFDAGGNYTGAGSGAFGTSLTVGTTVDAGGAVTSLGRVTGSVMAMTGAATAGAAALYLLGVDAAGGDFNYYPATVLVEPLWQQLASPIGGQIDLWPSAAFANVVASGYMRITGGMNPVAQLFVGANAGAEAILEYGGANGLLATPGGYRVGTDLTVLNNAAITAALTVGTTAWAGQTSEAVGNMIVGNAAGYTGRWPDTSIHSMMVNEPAGATMFWAGQADTFRWVNNANTVQWGTWNAASLAIATAASVASTLNVGTTTTTNELIITHGRQAAVMPAFVLGAAGAGVPIDWVPYSLFPIPPNLWTDNGTWLWPTGLRGVMANTASGFAYEAGGTIRTWWDGWVHTNSQVLIDGMLQTQSRLVTNAWDLGLANNLGGANTDVAGVLTIHGSNLYWEGSRAVRQWWDGVRIVSSHDTNAPSVTATNSFTILAGGFPTIRLGTQTYTGTLDAIEMINHAKTTGHFWAGQDVHAGEGHFIGRTGDTYVLFDGASAFYNIVQMPPITKHNFRHSNATWADVLGQSFNNVSSERFKEIEDVYPNALSVVMDPRVHAMLYKSTAELEYAKAPRAETPNYEAPYHVGFVAEDWHAVEPNVVTMDPEELSKPLALDYLAISSITFEGLKSYVAQTEPRLSAIDQHLVDIDAHLASLDSHTGHGQGGGNP